MLKCMGRSMCGSASTHHMHYWLWLHTNISTCNHYPCYWPVADCPRWLRPLIAHRCPVQTAPHSCAPLKDKKHFIYFKDMLTMRKTSHPTVQPLLLLQTPFHSNVQGPSTFTFQKGPLCNHKKNARITAILQQLVICIPVFCFYLATHLVCNIYNCYHLSAAVKLCGLNDQDATLKYLQEC